MTDLLTRNNSFYNVDSPRKDIPINYFTLQAPIIQAPFNPILNIILPICCKKSRPNIQVLSN